MTIENMWLDLKQLKGLKIDLHFIASKELKNELNEAIKQNEGNYICNIFSNKGIKELKYLKNNYLIKIFM